MKKLMAWLLTLVMVLCLVACSDGQEGQTEAPETEPYEVAATELGEGEVSFHLTVVDLDEKATVFHIHTDKTIVGEALQEQELIDGTVGEYGLYVTTVNGIVADWDKDGTYWAFYIDDQYALTGVDSTEISETANYSLVLTKG